MSAITGHGSNSIYYCSMDTTKIFLRQRRLGNYGFTSDHLIYGGHRLHIVWSILFNVMLQHGYNAKDLIVSSIIFISKDMKSSLSSSTNYRGISLFNAIGKLFDYAILLISNTSFQTLHMQFGFKQQHSTVMCSILYHEVINNYLCNGSNVCSCLLDASKAFDKVHYGTMFSILLNRNVPYCIIRLLIDGYVRQEARVIWNSCHSTYFR